MTKMDNRCLYCFELFVKSVNKMNSTVLVPSKLKDMDVVGNKILRQTGSIPPCLSNVDLYSFYVMLNDVKEELLWGPSSIAPLNNVTVDECCTPVRDKSSTVGSNRLSASLGVTLLTGGGAFGKVSGKHSRQPSSDGSLGSICSNTSSSSDFETDYEVDSFARDKELDDTTVHLAQAFRQHLQALHTILHQFADAADYLSLRYQEEIDSCF